MRISSRIMYETGVARMAQVTAEVARTQQQIASNRRILTPSDDPVNAVRALQMTQAKEVVARFSANRGNVDTSLSQVESVLGNVTSLLQSVKDKVMEAGNGGYSDTERAFLASELKGNLADLLGLANARDSEGSYMFAGFRTETRPYESTPAGAAYRGDEGQRMVQVDHSREMAMSVTGTQVFEAAGHDIFAAITDLIGVLEDTSLNADGRKAGLQTANDSVTAVLDNVLRVRADVGTRMREIESLNDLGATMDLEYTKALKDAQDLDYLAAISSLAQQQFMLEATQKSFMALTGMSLFNMMK